MSNVSQFSTTAASNNSASPNGFPEGMAPSGLNDSARELMAALAKCYKDQNGTITTGGTTTAYTLTTNNSHAALTDISLFAFQVNAANTGAATLAVDGLTAKSMQLNGAALAAGDLRTNEIVLAVYNPDNDVFDIFKSGLNQDVIKTDTINEQTTASGVTVDGVLLKDNGITATGTINFSSATVSDLGAVTTADINGGTIDGTVIGGSSAAAGSFTTLSASTSITGTLATAAQTNVTSLGTLTGLTVGGNIAVTGTVDGRDVAADGTKLDGIEAGADVTDATNVDAAGATMNTDTDVSSVSWVVDEDAMTSNLATKVPTQQSVKAYVDATVVAIGALSVSGTPVANDYARFTGAATIEGRSYSEAKTDFGFMTDLVDDTTPQLGGNLDGQDYTVSKINLKDYGEVTNAIGSIGGGTQDIDLTLGNSVSATVDTSSTTFTFSNPTASDELCGFILYLTNGGSQTVTWPASVDWPAATAPTLTASGIDILVFTTIDGGTTWYGNVVGQAYA